MSDEDFKSLLRDWMNKTDSRLDALSEQIHIACQFRNRLIGAGLGIAALVGGWLGHVVDWFKPPH